MKFLYSCGGLLPDGFLGALTSWQMRGVPTSVQGGALWAADLGCLAGPEYVKQCTVDNALPWLFEVMRPYRAQCLFVTVPDVVGDATATLEAFPIWRERLLGWPLAYVAQDGSEDLPFPAGARAIFVGGTTAWKLSLCAARVIARAVDVGLHVHIGRVNWRARYNHFRLMEGSDEFTCDGTRTRYGARQAVAAWRGYMAQIPLDFFVSGGDCTR